MIIKVLIKVRKQLFFVYSLGVLFLWLISGAFAVAAPLAVSINDTIAGYSTQAIINDASGSEEVVVYIKTPSGEILKILTDTNTKGVGKANILGFQLVESGEYSLTAVRNYQSIEDGPVTKFFVFADDPDTQKTGILTEKSSVKVGEKLPVKVVLKDAYSNPINHHVVQIYSSRDDDFISPTSIRTNEKGEAVFYVTSSKEGMSMLSIYDQTLEKKLGSEKKIYFYDDFSIGGDENMLSASLLDAGAQVDEDYNQVASFEIEFPDTVEVFSDNNYLTLRAKDKNGVLVKDFEGSVVIETPNDENAILPNNGKYTFTKNDQGEFTFSLSVVFSQTGNQVIEVFLEEDGEINPHIFGRKEVFVEEKTISKPSDPSDSQGISIDSPSDGSVFSTPYIGIQGVGRENSDIKIYVNDVFNQEIPVNSKGVFQGRITGLTTGEYKIYAMQKEGEREVSQEITVAVDLDKPIVKSFSLNPAFSVPGGTVEAVLISEPNLKTVELFWGNNQEFMKEVSPGEYVLSFTAPEKKEVYDFEAVLKDSIGNTLSQSLDKKLIVDETQVSDESPKNLEGDFLSDEQAFSLSWEKPGSFTPILYIVHARQKGNNTWSKVESVSGTENAAVIKNIVLGAIYEFSVSAVDEEGKEWNKSDFLELSSEIVVPIPTPTPVPKPEITPTPLITRTPTPVPISPLMKLIPQGNSIIVEWTGLPNAENHTVLYGVSSGEYLAKKEVFGDEDQVRIDDLIDGKRYFVRVDAKKNNGAFIKSYGEQSVVVGEKIELYHSAPPVLPYPVVNSEVGAKMAFFLAGIFFVLGSFFMLRREKR